MIAEHRLDRLRFRQGELDYDLEPPPYGRIEEFRMVRRRQEQTTRRPFVDLLEQHGDQAFQLSDLAAIVPALRHRVELIQEQDAVVITSKVQHRPYVAPGPPEERAHDRGEVQDGKGLRELASNPLGRECLSYARWPSEERGSRRVHAGQRQPLALLALANDLLQDCQGPGIVDRLDLEGWCLDHPHQG